MKMNWFSNALTAISDFIMDNIVDPIVDLFSSTPPVEVPSAPPVEMAITMSVPKPEVTPVPETTAKPPMSVENQAAMVDPIVDAEETHINIKKSISSKGSKSEKAKQTADTKSLEKNNNCIEEEDCIQCKPAPWMKIAKKEIGIHERTNRSRVETFVEKAIWGDRKGKSKIIWDKIRKKTFNVTKPSMAWCSCFVCWVIDETNNNTGKKFSRVRPGQTPENANSWIDRFPKGKKISPNIKPPYGAIMIMSSLKNSQSGHATFVSSYKKRQSKGLDEIVIVALGGNQNDQVNYTTYIFRKRKDGKYVETKYKSSYLRNFVLPKEYKYDINNPKCYEYDTKKGAASASTQ